MQRGKEPYDRYGRNLAHLFLPNGSSLEQALLAAGMGFHIAIPPNLGYHNCLRSAENAARRAGLGVWAHPYFEPLDARQLSHEVQGFRRVKGRVSSLDKTSSALWLEFEGDLVLRIKTSDLSHFDQGILQGLPGKLVVVRGWLVDRRSRKGQKNSRYKPWVMSLKHPLAIEYRPD